MKKTEDDEDKENAVPYDYAGPTGRPSRPVTGILTHANNVPFLPIEEQVIRFSFISRGCHAAVNSGAFRILHSGHMSCFPTLLRI